MDSLIKIGNKETKLQRKFEKVAMVNVTKDTKLQWIALEEELFGLGFFLRTSFFTIIHDPKSSKHSSLCDGVTFVGACLVTFSKLQDHGWPLES